SFPNVDLYSTPAEKREPWFIASIPFIKGLVDEDKNVFPDDCVGVSKDNVVDRQHQLGYENERVNETLVEKNDMLLLEEGDGVLDSEGGGRNHESGNVEQPANHKSDNVKQPANHESDNVKQPTNHESDNVKQPANHESDNVNQPANVSIPELFVEVHDLRQEVALIKVDDQRIANSTCSRPDMDNTEIAYDGMSTDKAYGKNEHTYSQANTSTLDVLIKAFDYSNDHPEIDVLGDVNDVDRSVPNMNHHATPEPVHVYDYLNVLNDEETVPNISLDDMKLQHEENNMTVKDRPVEHQPVDELIDGQKDKTTLLQEHVKDQIKKPKYVNVVKDDYKPPLSSVFARGKSKTKKCGNIETTKMWSINELMTIQEFIENLPRPHDCERDKVTVPDDISKYLEMKELQEYQFLWAFRDISVGRIF
ncbi:hypothetical protein Tco_1433966, partial [Tanacetum coccineum]